VLHLSKRKRAPILGVEKRQSQKKLYRSRRLSKKMKNGFMKMVLLDSSTIFMNRKYSCKIYKNIGYTPTLYKKF